MGWTTSRPLTSSSTASTTWTPADTSIGAPPVVKTHPHLRLCLLLCPPAPARALAPALAPARATCIQHQHLQAYMDCQHWPSLCQQMTVATGENVAPSSSSGTRHTDTTRLPPALSPRLLCPCRPQAVCGGRRASGGKRDCRICGPGVYGAVRRSRLAWLECCPRAGGWMNAASGEACQAAASWRVRVPLSTLRGRLVVLDAGKLRAAVPPGAGCPSNGHSSALAVCLWRQQTFTLTPPPDPWPPDRDARRCLCTSRAPPSATSASRRPTRRRPTPSAPCATRQTSPSTVWCGPRSCCSPGCLARWRSQVRAGVRAGDTAGRLSAVHH